MGENQSAQFTAGVAPESLWANYQWIYQYPYSQELGPHGSRLGPALEFGRWYARLFNGDKEADLTGLGPVVTAAGYATMLYTLFAALAHQHLSEPGLLKGRLDWAPRVALDEMFAALPADVRLALQAHGPLIEQKLVRHFARHNLNVILQIARERGQVNLLHARLPDKEEDQGYRDYTLAQYIRTGWTPNPDRRFTPYEVFDIRTALPVGTDKGNLKHAVLFPGEYRTLDLAYASKKWKVTEARVRSAGRGFYADLMRMRTLAGAPFAKPINLAQASDEMRRLAASVDPDAGPANNLLRRSRLGAAVLFEKLATPDPEHRDGLRLHLSSLDEVVAGLSAEDRAVVVRAAVESVHTQLDAATRARVVFVASPVAVPDETVAAYRTWFPNAELHTPDQTWPPVRYPQPSDRYAGAHSAPEVVTISTLDRQLDELAQPHGGLAGLAARFGITEQALRDVAYLTAAVYGTSFTLVNLQAMRRLGDVLRSWSGTEAKQWSDLVKIVQAVRQDAPSAPGTVDRGQVHRSQVQVLADVVAALNRDVTMDELREQVRHSPDLGAALRWIAPEDEVTASPDWPGVPRLLARLQTLAGAAGLPSLMSRVVDRHSLPDRPQALLDSAHLAAAIVGEQFTEADIKAIDRLLNTMPEHEPGMSGLERLIRYLLNDPPRTRTMYKQYSAAPYRELLVELARDMNRDFTLEDLRRQAAGIDKPTGAAAKAFTRSWRMRLRQHYAYHKPDLLQRLRDDVRPARIRSTRSGAQTWTEVHVLWDAVELFHALNPADWTAVDGKWITVEQAQTVRAVLDSPMTQGGRPLRTWADMQRFIAETIRGTDRPRPVLPMADVDDLNSLVAAAQVARAQRPGKPLTVRDLRHHFWNPPGGVAPITAQPAGTSVAGPSHA